ncbi:uncharacterized protein [Choristoneura fumiferana]|uniref:uncharacterized protein n=1 Tax=Choristoneura fumiferana TaxID=7141 RepID=UPI003D15AF4F
MVWMYLAVVALSVYFLNRWIRSNEKFEMIPGPKGIYIFENALDFLMDPVTLFYHFRKLGETYKQFYKVKLGHRQFIAILNPEDTEAVISSTKYNTKGFLYGFIEPWLKEGLLLSDGAKWLQRRKILTPTFHFNILRHFNVILEENSRKLVEELAAEVGKDYTDVATYITQFTLHSICETAMGTQLDKDTSQVGRSYKDAIIKLGVYAVYRAQRIWLYPNIIFSLTKIGRKQQKILDLMKSFRDNVIDIRRESENMLIDATNSNEEREISMSSKKRLAMLDLLLQAEREGITDANGIGEEVDTFMFAGHDTTSTALQFTLMLLANYPDVQNKVVAECNEIFKCPTQQATMSDLARMKYLECCIKESLRLYPPAHLIMRKLKEPLKLSTGGHEVPAGADCAIMLWELQRRSDQFVDPLEFHPERFMKEPTWHPYAFIPFSAGPRNCIGQKFAMNEMKFALSAVLRNYKLLPVTTPQNIVFITDFILRPTEPIKIKFEKRSSKTLGGLGLRTTSSTALPAFLSSVNSSVPLIRQILNVSNSVDVGGPYLTEATEVWRALCPEEDAPTGSKACVQRLWDLPTVKLVHKRLILQSPDAADRARILAVSERESGHWLHALPSTNLGTMLDPAHLRIAVCLSLGARVCEPHRCQCGKEVDHLGRHSLSCVRSAGRLYRHGALNDLIRRALTTASIPATLEPCGLLRDDGKRPDGATLVPWTLGRTLVWDATCVDTLAASHIQSTALRAGAAAEQLSCFATENSFVIRYRYRIRMWVFLLLTVIILCVVHVLLNYNSLARKMRKIQGPNGHFIVGNAFQFIVSPDDLMDLGRQLAKKFPNIYRFWCYPIGTVTIYSPEDIEIVTSTMKHSEKSRIYLFLKPWLQEGLLLSKGEKWQTRRKILTPTFHFNILRQFSKILQENSQRLLDILYNTAERPIDVVPVISEFTLSSICETAMGTQLNKDNIAEGKSYKEAIYQIGSIVTHRFVRIYLIVDFIFNLTSWGKAQKKVLDTIHRFTSKVIRERKELLRDMDLTSIGEKSDTNDDIFMKRSKKVAMLDLLISAEKDGLIDHAGIQEEVDTFMFEGHDTTASGLTFCMLLMANNKHIQDKAAKEINDYFGDTDRPIEMEDLANLRYLECCIKESLRIYPPVHFISRRLSEDVTLSNYHVPAGVECHISIFDLHHREDLFPNPSVFDPDRFLPENCVGRHPYAYIPFSAGPRNCIGQKFAMLEMKLLMAEVLRKFELQPVTRPVDLKFVADLVLRNKSAVYVTFAKRNNTRF